MGLALRPLEPGKRSETREVGRGRDLCKTAYSLYRYGPIIQHRSVGRHLEIPLYNKDMLTTHSSLVRSSLASFGCYLQASHQLRRFIYQAPHPSCSVIPLLQGPVLVTAVRPNLCSHLCTFGLCRAVSYFWSFFLGVVGSFLYFLGWDLSLFAMVACRIPSSLKKMGGMTIPEG